MNQEMQYKSMIENEDAHAFEDPNWFAVRFHHGGEFLYHPKTVYMGGEVETITRLDGDRMSMSVLNKFYMGLGYKEHSSYYYLLPGSEMESGLVLLSTDEAILQMKTDIDPNMRIIEIFCKHSEEDCDTEDDSPGYSGSAYGDSDVDKEIDDFTLDDDEVGQENEKDIEDEVGQGNAKAKGKGKVVYKSVETVCDKDNNKNRSKGVVINENTEDEFYVKSDFEYDSDDFESLDGSEDFDEDDPRQVMGRKNTPKFKRFNPLIDMSDPMFELGMEFSDTKEFKDDVRSYSVKQVKGIRFVKNEKLKISARCKEGCPWYIYGSQLKSEGNAFRVRTFVNKHSCSNVLKSRCANSRWIGDTYTERYQLNPTWPADSFFNTVGKELKIEVSRSSAYRALKVARTNVEVSLKDQYGSLWDYKEELIRSNPGSTVEILCEHEK